ncbi:MAG: ribosomal protein S18-alanine N-acetyltransferase [Chloroflexi bacterium]|nr:ribosomal protein S18-alanine N-acetyltransferase [Chloroflexota bacterium]
MSRKSPRLTVWPSIPRGRRAPISTRSPDRTTATWSCWKSRRAKPSSNWRRIIGNFGILPESNTVIVGYGGLWNIVDEAHVSTIATHPQFRGNGWGEVLLAAMIRRALTLGAAYIVLEVRVSNVVAQNLYKKYGFETVGTKTNYYHSNNEDAYDMRLNFTNPAAYRETFDPRFEALKARHHFADQYTDVRPIAK